MNEAYVNADVKAISSLWCGPRRYVLVQYESIDKGSTASAKHSGCGVNISEERHGVACRQLKKSRHDVLKAEKGLALLANQHTGLIMNSLGE